MKHVVACIALLALLVPRVVGAETLKVDVASVKAGVDPFTSQPNVTLTLAPDSVAAIGAFTKARVGEQVRMRVGDRVLSEPTIREPIAEGTIVISGSLTEEDARSLADAIVRAGNAFEVDGSDK